MNLRFLLGVSWRSQPPCSRKRCCKKGAMQQKHSGGAKHGHRQHHSCIHIAPLPKQCWGQFLLRAGPDGPPKKKKHAPAGVQASTLFRGGGEFRAGAEARTNFGQRLGWFLTRAVDFPKKSEFGICVANDVRLSRAMKASSRSSPALRCTFCRYVSVLHFRPHLEKRRFILHVGVDWKIRWQLVTCPASPRAC